MISWGDGSGDIDKSGRIFMDAVTAYTQSHTGKVTSHPIDGAGLISDHFVKDNSKFNVSAVITAVDIATENFLIEDPEGNAALNTRVAPSAVSVQSTDNSVLSRLIPSGIGQFFSDTKPTVIVDSSREDQLEQVRGLLTNLMSGVIFNEKTSQFDPNIQLVTLYEYDGILLRKPVYNLVITSIVFREDQNTGYGLYCNFSFEQVTFALLKKTTIPKDVTASIKKKSESKSTKGNQDGTPDVGTPPKDVDPLRQARENG
jgi:hypothetical protein